MSYTTQSKDGLFGNMDLDEFAKNRVRRRLNLEQGAEIPEDSVVIEHARLVGLTKDFQHLQLKNRRRYGIEFFSSDACRLVDSKKAYCQHYAPKSFRELALEIIKLAKRGDVQSTIACDLLSMDKEFASLVSQVESGEIPLSGQKTKSWRNMSGFQRHSQYLLGLIDSVAYLTSNLLVDNPNLKTSDLSYQYAPKKVECLDSILPMFCEEILTRLKLAHDELSPVLKENDHLVELLDVFLSSPTNRNSEGNAHLNAENFSRIIDAVKAITQEEYPEFDGMAALPQSQADNIILLMASVNNDVGGGAGVSKIDVELNAVEWLKQASSEEISDLYASRFDHDPGREIFYGLVRHGSEKAQQFLNFADSIGSGNNNISVTFNVDDNAVNQWIQANRSSCLSHKGDNVIIHQCIKLVG